MWLRSARCAAFRGGASSLRAAHRLRHFFDEFFDRALRRGTGSATTCAAARHQDGDRCMLRSEGMRIPDCLPGRESFAVSSEWRLMPKLTRPRHGGCRAEATSHNPTMARETQTIDVHALGTVTFRPSGKVGMERVQQAATSELGFAAPRPKPESLPAGDRGRPPGQQTGRRASLRLERGVLRRPRRSRARPRRHRGRHPRRQLAESAGGLERPRVAGQPLQGSRSNRGDAPRRRGTRPR